MEDTEDASRSAAPLRALAGAAAESGARELLLAGEGGKLPRAAELAAVGGASGLPVVACADRAPGLSLGRLLLEEGAARIAARVDGPQSLERLRALAEVFGAARADALLVLHREAPGDPALAAAFGLAARWEAAPPPDGDVSGAAGLGAEPVALARAARDAGAGRILLRAACGGTPPDSLVDALEAASGLPVLRVAATADASPIGVIRGSRSAAQPSSAA